MEILLSVCVGIALSSACGFRIFVPPLVISIASISGHLTLSHGFQWMGTWPALTAFAVATLLEILAYYIPWLDNILDMIATPAAVIAGIVMTASVVSDMSPFLKWTLAVIAGGGAAALVQLGTVKVRAVSTALTGGVTNHIVSSAETAASGFISALSVILPIAGAVLVAIVLIYFTYRHYRHRRRAPEEGVHRAP